jgi:hypothetical protein
MTTTYTWNVANLERETSGGCVFIAHYTVDAKDDTYSAGAYGSIGLERPAEGMIPFADLTPEIVTHWVREKFGPERVFEIEAALQKRIDEQRTPTTSQGIPWSNVAGVQYEPTVLPEEEEEEVVPVTPDVDESVLEAPTEEEPAPVVGVDAQLAPVDNDTTEPDGGDV